MARVEGMRGIARAGSGHCDLPVGPQLQTKRAKYGWNNSRTKGADGARMSLKEGCSIAGPADPGPSSFRGRRADRRVGVEGRERTTRCEFLRTASSTHPASGSEHCWSACCVCTRAVCALSYALPRRDCPLSSSSLDARIRSTTSTTRHAVIRGPKCKITAPHRG